VVDEKAEKYTFTSSYTYALNNPLKFVDPNGKDAKVAITGNTITISTTIYIYGSGANDIQASKMQATIMKDWNKGFSYTNASTGEKYKVSFDVNVQVYNKDNPNEGPGFTSVPLKPGRY
jgi:hypothetical protein